MTYSTSIDTGPSYKTGKAYVKVPGKYGSRKDAMTAAFKFKASKHLAGKIVLWEG